MITTGYSVATVRSPDGSRLTPFGGNSVQHGTAVFEGIRCYDGRQGPGIFRLDDHLERLLYSARAMGLPHELDLETLRGRVIEAARRSGLRDSYLRPVLLSEDTALGIDLTRLTFTLAIEVWPCEAVPELRPIAVCVSPWNRLPKRCFPSGAKATGVYAVSAVARTHASLAGFDDAIQLDPDSGRVAEATVANVFAVIDGVLCTPGPQDSMLPGITRASILAIAAELGIAVAEGPLEVAQLLAATEAFLCGTAIELAPVGRIGDRTLPARRPVFDRLWSEFRSVVAGDRPHLSGWLAPVGDLQPARAHSHER